MADKECIPTSTGPGTGAQAAKKTPRQVPAPSTGANLTKGSSTPDAKKVKG